MPSKPFLRKRGGFTGRYLEKVNYPVLRSAKIGKSQRVFSYEEHDSDNNVQQMYGSTSTSSGALDKIAVPLENKNEEMQDTNRPYTAGTADSGCLEDAGSIILSPSSDRKRDGIESVVVDVTDNSNNNSGASSEIQSTRGIPSVIPDLSNFSNDESQAVSKAKHDDCIVQKGFADKILGDSTAEFERIESQLQTLTSPGASENSYGTDDTRSQHWKQVIKEFAAEAKKKTGVLPLESVSTNESRFENDKMTSGSFSNGIVSNLYQTSQKEASKKLHTMRETFPSIFNERTGNSIYAHVKKIENKTQTKNTALLAKSFEKLDSDNIPQIKESQYTKSSLKERNLAKQLRDLIAHLDVANENRRHEYERFEEIFNRTLEEKEYFCQQVEELKKRILQLEEDEKARKENHAPVQDAENQRITNLELIKRKTVIPSQKKHKSDEDSDIIKLLKEQIGDLRGMLRDLERQRTEMRTQIRKNNSVVKEKNDIIEQLRGEKERLEKRIAVITSNKAALRGRQAENAFTAQAISRASNSATVTTATKHLAVHNNQFRTPSCKNVNQMDSATNKSQNGISFADNTNAFSDNEEVAVVERGKPAPHSVKNVRWNEPLATAAVISPIGSTPSFSNDANSDMQLILTENNMIGRASLYRGEKDFTVYTLTHCGCHFYEYSNTDIRWIHSTKRYQINYYGQLGATTVENDGRKLLVRHFLSGQLEIYRESGETTLVTPDGRRTEVVRDSSGSVRIEIYELDGRVRVKGRMGDETTHRATQTSCHRLDGSYVSHVSSDDSLEWRSSDYVVHRFKNGDTKVRLNLIDTSITMLIMDVGTVKHLSDPINRRLPKYCVEWGTIARKRSRVIAATQSRVLSQL